MKRMGTSVQEAVSNGKGETVRDRRLSLKMVLQMLGEYGVCKRDKIQR